jgi:hypothetical protein
MEKILGWGYFFMRRKDNFHCWTLFLLFTACTSRESALEEPPIITSATYQHTQYNGRNQPVEVKAAKDDAPPFVVSYFTSEENLENDEGGLAGAPLEVGDYFVRIERPAGNGYKQGKNIKIEYHIQKAFIEIIADGTQRFVYDGGAKEIVARAEPPVELVVTYFAPSNSAANNQTGNGSQAPTGPPVERGQYRALISFSGNARYMGASKEIELRIE